MNAQLRPALTIFPSLSVITGLIYPRVVTGVAQIVLPHQANGSIISVEGEAYGSELIGQQFDAPKYFWGARLRLGTMLPLRLAPIMDR